MKLLLKLINTIFVHKGRKALKDIEKSSFDPTNETKILPFPSGKRTRSSKLEHIFKKEREIKLLWMII